MINVFSILAFFFILLGVGYAFFHFVYARARGPFKPILHVLTFVGVIVHELSHFFMSELLGVRTEGFQVNLKHRGRYAPNGQVGIKPGQRRTFLQAFMVSMAPLFVSTWLFLWSLHLAFTENLDLWIRVLCGFFCVSLLLGSTPSRQDFRVIGFAFHADPSYSVYQSFLLIVAGIVMWIITFAYDLLLFDFVFYILVGIMYFCIKYSIRGVNFLFIRVFHLSRRFHFSRMNKKRMKPKKPEKIGIKQIRW